MSSEQVRLGKSETDKHKQLDREIREMVSAITHRVTDDDEDGGARIITLTGKNTGATLKSETEEKLGKSHIE